MEYVDAVHRDTLSTCRIRGCSTQGHAQHMSNTWMQYTGTRSAHVEYVDAVHRDTLSTCGIRGCSTQGHAQHMSNTWMQYTGTHSAHVEYVDAVHRDMFSTCGIRGCSTHLFRLCSVGRPPPWEVLHTGRGVLVSTGRPGSVRECVCVLYCMCRVVHTLTHTEHPFFLSYTQIQ